MKTIFLISSLLLLVTISQCNNPSIKSSHPIIGQYDLVVRDNSGQLAFTGTITFQSLEENHLKGQCKFIREKNAPEAIDKDGPCEAMLEGKKIDLDSAPFMDDAGLLLEGEFDGLTIRGKWMIDGFATSPPLGTFEAEKKR